jgi:hypothetical protein
VFATADRGVLQLAAVALSVLQPELPAVPASAATPAVADSNAWRRLSLKLFSEFDLDTMSPLRARRRPFAVISSILDPTSNEWI